MRERLGDPRVVPSFRCTSLPGMPPSPTPGSSTSICSRTSMPTWPSPFDHRLGTPDIPAIRFAREADFVASLVCFRYGLPGCSPPCTDRTGTPQPSGTFTSRLSTDRSPSPSLDITTTVTGLLCWRDSHPLEWQLASLHDQVPPFPQRSPPRLLTDAACGGLKPAPDGRLRRTYLHLSHSSAPPYVGAFVAHSRRHRLRLAPRVPPFAR